MESGLAVEYSNGGGNDYELKPLPCTYQHVVSVQIEAFILALKCILFPWLIHSGCRPMAPPPHPQEVPPRYVHFASLIIINTPLIYHSIAHILPCIMANANQRKINGVGSGKSSSLLSSSTWEKSTALTMCLWLYEETSFPVTAFHTLLGGGRGTKKKSVIQQTLVWRSPDLFHLPWHIYSRSEVSCSSSRLAGISVETGPPHCALVSLKCANPVPCVPLAEHWLPI